MAQGATLGSRDASAEAAWRHHWPHRPGPLMRRICIQGCRADHHAPAASNTHVQGHIHEQSYAHH
jgi:hypothetical protein